MQILPIINIIFPPDTIPLGLIGNSAMPKDTENRSDSDSVTTEDDILEVEEHNYENIEVVNAEEVNFYIFF